MMGFGMVSLTQANGQLKKFYSLKEDAVYDTVKLSLEASAGTCFIKSTANSTPLNIYGNPNLDRINPSFKSSVNNNTCDVKLKLEEFETSSFDDGFSFASFFTGTSKSSNKKVKEDFWKVYLSDDKVYDLDLKYGIGEANLDFSGTSMKKVKINTGSANVNLNYSLEKVNPIQMDTFYVKVDLGSLEAAKMNYLNASEIIAEVGFGNAVMDFKSGKNSKCNVKASVGAGKIDIILPDDTVPVIIYVKESPMCGVKIAEGYEKVEKNTYVNMSYRADAENLLTFNVDVSFGNVNFMR